MDDRWAALAARLNEAVDSPAAAPIVDSAEAVAARDALLADLLAFGEALRGVEVAGDGAAIEWRTALRKVRFEPDGAEIQVRWSEPAPRSGRLYREEALGGKWVLVAKSVLTEDRVPLVDAGLLRLVTQGLGQPSPAVGGAAPTDDGASDEAAPADAPAERRRSL